MNTLILYATKFGSVGECAELIAAKLSSGITIADISRKPVPLPDSFDQIILGCSVHAGRIQKSIINYVIQNETILDRKQTALFVCGLDAADKSRELVEKQFPAAFVKNTAAMGFPGGKVTFSKMNFLYKSMMKKITGRSEDFSTIEDSKIAEFVKALD